jgi:hypothetical protein
VLHFKFETARLTELNCENRSAEVIGNYGYRGRLSVLSLLVLDEIVRPFDPHPLARLNRMYDRVARRIERGHRFGDRSLLILRERPSLNCQAELLDGRSRLAFDRIHWRSFSCSVSNQTRVALIGQPGRSHAAKK